MTCNIPESLFWFDGQNVCLDNLGATDPLDAKLPKPYWSSERIVAYIRKIEGIDPGTVEKLDGMHPEELRDRFLCEIPSETEITNY